ncbi:hypothetical protein [Paludibacterium purpuratum]|uniref:Uncharacterized protein n=1 Tax=Paludibacterium purpuratum TaxID=1144873 RepID=A0A4V3DV04_9NEIS|nr:hypothetical protein [Paludibacterium purpuratum]TDR78367.1 hypothetical protein DFP86_10884 [Paludibacterium purpuratum]
MRWFDHTPLSFELTAQPDIPLPAPSLGPKTLPEPLAGPCEVPRNTQAPLLTDDPLAPWPHTTLDRFARLPDAIDRIALAEVPCEPV